MATKTPNPIIAPPICSTLLSPVLDWPVYRRCVAGRRDSSLWHALWTSFRRPYDDRASWIPSRSSPETSPRGDGMLASRERRRRVHPTEVSGIENGGRDARVASVFRLATALSVRPGQLLDGL